MYTMAFCSWINIYIFLNTNRSAHFQGTSTGNNSVNTSPATTSDDATLVLTANVVNPAAPLMPHVLSAVDDETKSSARLSFRMQNSLDPASGDGQLVNVDDIYFSESGEFTSGYYSNDKNNNKRLLTFYQRDVDDLKLVYLPPATNSTALAVVDRQRTLFELEFTVRDDDEYGDDDSGRAGAEVSIFTVELARRPVPGYVRRRICVVEGGSSELPEFYGEYIEAVVVGGLKYGRLAFLDGDESRDQLQNR
jgi:hypothetical protein